MDKLFAIVGILLLIAGGIGLLLTHANLEAGDIDWVLGNLTYGTFTVVGLVFVVFLVLVQWESS